MNLHAIPHVRKALGQIRPAFRHDGIETVNPDVPRARQVFHGTSKNFRVELFELQDQAVVLLECGMDKFDGSGILGFGHD